MGSIFFILTDIWRGCWLPPPPLKTHRTTNPPPSYYAPSRIYNGVYGKVFWTPSSPSVNGTKSGVIGPSPSSASRRSTKRADNKTYPGRPHRLRSSVLSVTRPMLSVSTPARPSPVPDKHLTASSILPPLHRLIHRMILRKSQGRTWPCSNLFQKGVFKMDAHRCLRNQ